MPSAGVWTIANRTVTTANSTRLTAIVSASLDLSALPAPIHVLTTVPSRLSDHPS